MQAKNARQSTGAVGDSDERVEEHLRATRTDKSRLRHQMAVLNVALWLIIDVVALLGMDLIEYVIPRAREQEIELFAAIQLCGGFVWAVGIVTAICLLNINRADPPDDDQQPGS